MLVLQNIYLSPLGIMGVVKSHDVFLSLKFGEYVGDVIEIPELDAYFSGDLMRFSLAFRLSGTAFQIQVWQALQAIPYGQTWSYQQVANAIGQPKAVRAVSNAIAANPLHVLIPCHRVIHSNGDLGGYQGGIERKLNLLHLELELKL